MQALLSIEATRLAIKQGPDIHDTAMPYTSGCRGIYLSSQAQPVVIPIDIHQLYLDTSWWRAVHSPVLDIDLPTIPWCNLHMHQQGVSDSFKHPSIDVGSPTSLPHGFSTGL